MLRNTSSNVICGGCEGVALAQSLVKDAIIAAVAEIVAEFNAREFSRVTAYLNGLIEVLDSAPESIAELLGRQRLEEFRRNVRLVLTEIQENNGKLSRLHGLLFVWVTAENKRLIN